MLAPWVRGVGAEGGKTVEGWEEKALEGEEEEDARRGSCCNELERSSPASESMMSSVAEDELTPIAVSTRVLDLSEGGGGGGVGDSTTGDDDDSSFAPPPKIPVDPFLNVLNLAASLSLFSSFPPMTQVRLSSVSFPFLWSRLRRALSLAGKGGISSKTAWRSSSSSPRETMARYSHARC